MAQERCSTEPDSRRGKLGHVALRWGLQMVLQGVDGSDKTTKVWKAKEKTGSETYSVSEMEKKNISLGLSENDKAPRAETSFTKNDLGLQKPTLEQNTTTDTLSCEIKNKQKDRTGGPAPYGSKHPMALRNSFHVLETNVEVLP
ncbi:hypothetical protein Bca4012_081799 [Brassica carinata]|uniref:Uncharacterized protein n=1 Tax=Brassica carinata TaxID=52824 RepID=A0A8X8AP39_BRACI|nr:hypothetical protein Bca52824_029028 [Brassica carinata]